MLRIASLLSVILICASVTAWLASRRQSGWRADTHALRADLSQLAHAPEQPRSTYTVHVRQPPGPPRIELAGTDPQGRVASVACSTCHRTRQPNLENNSAAALDEFHQGMTFQHGSLACYACHSPDDADALRLADGSALGYGEVLQLCSQCHSKQAESFAHGAHGGMNGYWDLTRGPQTKNNCIDCHDPHLPNYPKMIVGFKPKDRFNVPLSTEAHHEGAATDDHH